MDQPVPEQPAPPPLPDLPEPLEVHPPETPSPQPPPPPPTKEVPKLPLIAILLFVVMLTIVGVVWLLGRSSEQVQLPSPSPVPTAISPPGQRSSGPAATPAALLPTLFLESPQDRESTTAAQIVVRGKTSANTVVVFFTDADENAIVSDSTGTFTGLLSLAPGVNMINVSAVRFDGSEKSELREVTLISRSSQQASQGSKKMVSGTVTGVNDAIVTILLANQPDSFYTVRADSATVRVENGTPLAIADLILGQRIVVVGTVEGENTMIAKLIHILSQNTP